MLRYLPRLDLDMVSGCSAPVTSLRPNLVKRIDRLPKPTSVAAAMQPLFEAISNAIHSVQKKFGETVTTEGRVFVTVNINRKKEGVWATVEDNGLGLNDRNWDPSRRPTPTTNSTSAARASAGCSGSTASSAST